MSARPGRIMQDIPIELPEDSTDERRSATVRTSTEFAAYKETIASAIYHAHS